MSVSVHSFRMSSDLLVKKYRGYSYRLPFRTVQFVIRHPSEWISPRTNSHGWASTISCCQLSRTIRRSCFLPGPCCGNMHVQCRP
ncbi:hypothetical protein ADK52_05130 [Streptomyces sp. WM6372]|nr:hypothetical protein ADK52_05130 [Streptomyces sp. WM6372]